MTMNFKTTMILCFVVVGAIADPVPFYEDDPYADFLNPGFGSTTNEHFALDNPGCFTVPDPFGIAFKNWDTLNRKFPGPFCLHGFEKNDDGKCTGFITSEQYSHITNGNLGTSAGYKVSPEMSRAGNYKFTNAACEHPDTFGIPISIPAQTCETDCATS